MPNKKHILFALTGIAALAMAIPALAADNNTYVEGGYASDMFAPNAAPDANDGYLRGSMGFTDMFSGFAEFSSGSFSENVTPGSDTHQRYGLGLALNSQSGNTNLQFVGAWYSEKFGDVSDKYFRVGMLGHGQFEADNNWGWDAGVVFNFKADPLRDGAGGVFGVRYRLAPQWQVVLNTETFSEDTRAELGVRWNP